MTRAKNHKRNYVKKKIKRSAKFRQIYPKGQERGPCQEAALAEIINSRYDLGSIGASIYGAVNVMNRFTNRALIFPDATNLCFSSVNPEHNGKGFIRVISRYLTFGRNIGSIKKFLTWIDRALELYKDFLSRDEVMVTSGVKSELDNHFENVSYFARLRSYNKPHSLRYLSAFKSLSEIVDNNHRRIRESGIESDPVIDRITELIPEEGYQDVSPPSQTDKRLIAMSYSIGLLDGRTKVIISQDKGITQAVRKIGRKLEDNPELLNLSDISVHPRGFDLRVYSVIESQGRFIPSLHTKITYSPHKP